MNNAKRLWSILTVLALAGALQLACGGGTPAPPTEIPPTATPAPTSTPVPTPTPSASDHVNQGMILIEEGKLDAAAAEFQKAIELDPEYADAHRNMGYVYWEQGKFEEAITAYEKAIEVAPDFGEAYGDMAGALVYLDRIPEAVAAGEKAIELAPDYANAHNNLGLAYSRQGELEKAIAEYKEAIRLDPDDPQPHTNLGLIYRKQDRLDDAIAEFQEAIRLDPDDPENHNSLAIAYYIQGKADDAISVWLEALAIDPDHAPTHKNLGIAYRDLGRIEEAIAEFEAYLQLRPDASDRAAIEEEIADLEEMLASPVAEYSNDEGGYSLVYLKTLHYADEDAWVAFSESQEAVDAVFGTGTEAAFQEAPVFIVDAIGLEDMLDDLDLGIAADAVDIVEALSEQLDAEIDTTQTATLDGYPSALAEVSGDYDGVPFKGALVVVIVDERMIGVFGLAVPDQWDAFFSTYLDMVNSLSFFEASSSFGDVMPTKAAP